MRHLAISFFAIGLAVATGLPALGAPDAAGAADKASDYDIQFSEAVEKGIDAYVTQADPKAEIADDAIDRAAAQILKFSWPIPLPEKKPEEISAIADESVKHLVDKKYSKERLTEATKQIMERYGPVTIGQKVKFRVKGAQGEVSGILTGIQYQNRIGAVTAVRVDGMMVLTEDIVNEDFLKRLDPKLSMPMVDEETKRYIEQHRRLREKYAQQIRPQVDQILFEQGGYLRLGDKWRSPEEMVVLVSAKIKKLLGNKRKSEGLQTNGPKEDASGWGI